MISLERAQAQAQERAQAQEQAQAQAQEQAQERAQERTTQKRGRGRKNAPSAADLFPGLEQRTFFCSALVAAGLKALGVISPDLNDNYFWPGAFAEGGDIDYELDFMEYTLSREVLIDPDTLAVAKLTQMMQEKKSRQRPGTN